VTLQKYFSHPNLVIYLFLATPIKLKLRPEIGGRPLIETHLDQSNYLGNQQPVLSFAVPFASLSTLKNCWVKTILLSQISMF
jgi:hypothetical protein